MIALDDARWAQLTHAYGSAADIPARLRELPNTPGQRASGQEPWATLWSSLCHQGDVYSASYAAVPHVVATALSVDAALDFSFFLLPASVEVARVTGRGPEIPDFLAPAYHEALGRLPDAVAAHRHRPWDQDMTIATAAALAVAKGHHALAEAVMNLDDDWIGKINHGEFD
jgi:hypothetical protein